MSSPLRCYLSCIFSQFTREKTSDAFKLACRFLLCGFDEKLQAGRLFAISVRSESTHTYKQRHPVPGHRSCVEVSAFPHCLVNSYQRYQPLRSRLCKMGLHGLYLDVIIGVGQQEGQEGIWRSSARSRWRSPRRGRSDDYWFEADRPRKGKVTLVPSGAVPAPGRLGSRRFFAWSKHGASSLLSGRSYRPIRPHQTIVGTTKVLVVAPSDA